MNRVSTSGGYSSVLSNLMSAQQRQAEAGDQLSTGKVGTDLKAFSRNAQVLTAMQTLDTRLTGFTEQNAFTANRLEIQDLALNKAADAADRTRLAISNALASDRADALMTELERRLGAEHPPCRQVPLCRRSGRHPTRLRQTTLRSHRAVNRDRRLLPQ